jgi:hypothetical protein
MLEERNVGCLCLAATAGLMGLEIRLYYYGRPGMDHVQMPGRPKILRFEVSGVV